MTVEGRTVKHCSGKKKGKVIKKHKTRKAALRQHRAIMASKRRRRKKKK
jgi:hypothetical protein